jgi:predicted acylesterase/phospholipase RssA
VGGDELARYFDEVEAENQHVLYRTDTEITPWTERVLRRADRVVVVVNSAPDGDDDRRVQAAFEVVAETPYVARWLAVVHSPETEHPNGSELAERYGVDQIVHLHAGSAVDEARLARLVTGNGVGLALGGGGARALGHIGVLRALEECGVAVDAVAGSSMGAMLGAAMAKNLSSSELAETARRDFKGLLDFTLPAVSLFGGKRIAAALETQFGGWAFEDLWLPFVCTSTNLTESRLEVHRAGPIAPALRASGSIPGVLPPVPRDGHLLVDGGVLDNLPVEPLRKTGLVTTVIAVDVAPALGPRAKADFGLSVSGWKVLRSRFGKGRSPHPRLSAILMRSMLVGAMRDRNLGVAEGVADLYLDLDMRGIPLLDFKKPEPIIAAGYESALPRIKIWRQGLTGSLQV